MLSLLALDSGEKNSIVDFGGSKSKYAVLSRKEEVLIIFTILTTVDLNFER